MELSKIDTVTQHYLIAMLWSTHNEKYPDSGEFLDIDYGIGDIADDSINQAARETKAFVKKAGPLLDGIDDEQIGHDIWLTRAGHGVGFWDRGLGERGDKLTELCKKMGEKYPCVGDDGKVYIE